MDKLVNFLNKVKTLLFPGHQFGVGVDMTDTTITVVVLRKEGNKYHLVTAVTQPIPEGGMKGYKIQNPDLMARLLKELWSRHQIPVKHASVVLNTKDVVLRVMEFGKASHEKMDKWIEEKLSQYVLLAEGETIYAWQKVSSFRFHDEFRVQVLVAAIKKDLYLPYAQVFKGAGLRLAATSLPSIALLRAIRDQAASFHNVLVISVQSEQTMMHIVDRGAIVYSHGLGISESALSSEPSLTVFLENVTTLFHTVGEKMHVRKVILEFGLAGAELLAETLAQRLALPVELARPDLNIGDGAFPNTDMRANMRSIGLALLEPLTHNLVPDDQYREFGKKISLYIAAFSWVSAGVILAVFFGLFLANVLIRSQISDIQKELRETQAHYLEVQKKDEEMNKVKILIKSRRDIVKHAEHFVWYDAFRELPILISRNIRFLSIQIGRDLEVKVEGEARYADDVFQFIKKLRTASYFVNPRLDEVVQETSAGTVKFRILAHIKRGSFK